MPIGWIMKKKKTERKAKAKRRHRRRFLEKTEVRERFRQILKKHQVAFHFDKRATERCESLELESPNPLRIWRAFKEFISFPIKGAEPGSEHLLFLCSTEFLDKPRDLQIGRFYYTDEVNSGIFDTTNGVDCVLELPPEFLAQVYPKSAGHCSIVSITAWLPADRKKLVKQIDGLKELWKALSIHPPTKGFVYSGFR
jgi:hypothetical protein